MKKLLLCFVLTIFIFSAYSQGLTLKINSKNITADSLHLQQFDGRKNFKNVISIPYSAKATFKQKRALPAGYYQVCGDTNLLFELLISDNKKENFVVTINGDIVHFENSDENNINIALNQHNKEFQFKRDSLSQVFEKAQKTESQQVLQQLANILIKESTTLTGNDDAYKLRIAVENKGSLIASIAQFSREIPEAQQMPNKDAFLQYYTKHIFDHYNFQDTRMLTHPMLYEKLKDWCGFAFEMKISDGARTVSKLLTKAKVNDTTYNAFFDYLERDFGFFKSDHWTEDIYLEMLRNALDYNKLENSRRVRYETLYALHNKNLAGQQVPNFNILWPDNSTSTLYDIESDYLILFFQNPDCPTCTEMRRIFAANDTLNQAIDNGKIKVLTIYFNEDENLWRNYVKTKANPRYLHGWEFEHKIVDEDLFYTPYIPFLFLLDKDKKVIKKELLKDEVNYYLEKLNLIQKQ